MLTLNQKLINLISITCFILFTGLSNLPAQKLEVQKSKVGNEVNNLQTLISEISSKLWDYSETALKETKSSNLLIQKLESNGFNIEKNIAGLETAFIAEYGEGKPVIGILAEFDALPGVGNKVVPNKEKRDDNITAGQGCGHNLFGAASVGAAIAVKNWMHANSISGTIKLFGTPAEETVVGKVYMAKAGVFNKLDAVLEWHPGTKNSVRNQPGRALNNFEVEFFGQSAHASGDPWNGRSALDAVELMNYGVNMMREHIKPTARIHYVIPNGGEAPNVVPEYAKVWYYVRDINRTEVNKNYSRILKIAEGAALATGTTYKVKLITGVHEYLLNRPLQEAIQKNLENIGAPVFTAKEQTFATTLQKNLNIKEVGFITKVEPLTDKPGPVKGGSTDVAEASWIVPTAGFRIATAADGIPWHSWAATACHGTKASHKSALIAAKILAATAVDLFLDSDLIIKAKSFFKEASKGVSYESPLDEK